MNAARHYREAAALLATPTRAEKKILARAKTISLGQTTWDFIRRSEAALDELYRGANLPECDWGPDAVQELESNSKLALQMFRLGAIACLRIRHAFQRQETRAAVEELFKLLKVARHVGRGGTFLFKVTQLGLESQVVDVAAACLPEQDAWMLQALADELQTLPSAGTLLETVQQEKRFVLGYARSQIENKSRSEALALLRQGASEAEAQAILRAAGDAQGLVRLIDDWAMHMDELGAILMGPLDQVHAALVAFTERRRVANPLAVPFVRQTEGVVYAVARADTRLAMLRAAVAIVRDGADPQQPRADSGNCGPFECRPFKGGFELRANLPFPGRPPAILVVGRNKGIVPWLRLFLKGFLS